MSMDVYVLILLLSNKFLLALQPKGGKQMNSPRLMNLTNLAHLLGVSRETCYQWLYSEQLPAATKIINKRRYWTADQIETFLKEQTK